MSSVAPKSQSMAANRRLHCSGHHNQVPYITTHEKIENPPNTQNFIDNKLVDSATTKWIDLHDPATNNLVTRVPQSTPDELKAAVESAKKAFPAWKKTSLMHRQQVMFKLAGLIRENWDRLAASITLEQGKTFADAQGDVLRGLQVVEVCAMFWGLERGC